MKMKMELGVGYQVIFQETNKLGVDMEKRREVYCIDCKQAWEIDSNQPIGEAVPGHTWGYLIDERSGEKFDEKFGFDLIRHITQEDKDFEESIKRHPDLILKVLAEFKEKQKRNVQPLMYTKSDDIVIEPLRKIK